jgi:DivIVA domain-containing protein
MELGPRDIHDKQFHDEWRGYNREEVDDFLDRVAETLDQVKRSNDSLSARVRELESQLAQAREGEQMLKKTLVTAQQHAEQAVATARARADKMVAEASERGRALMDEARAKATSIETDARKRAQETERAGEHRKRELESAIERLRALESETKQKLKTFLDTQQRSLTSLSERRPGATPTPQPTAGQAGARAPQQRPAPGQATPSRQPATAQPQPEPRDPGARPPSETPPRTEADPAGYEYEDEESTARRTLRSLFGRDEE